MTNEEAKTVFLNWGYVEVEGRTEYDADKWREACRIISEWLEQEPKYCDRNICTKNEYNGIGCDECEVTKSREQSGDLISRQAVLDMWRQMICYDRTCHARDEGRCTETFCDFKLFEYQINHMPSVKPQEPKTGYREYNDIYDHYLCGNCKTIVMDYDNFCPNCGAKMD